MPGLKQSLLGMGNPLLDVIATVDQAFLDKYKVKHCCLQDKQQAAARSADDAAADS